ncbi:annexin A1-like [Diretmus argenteus]
MSFFKKFFKNVIHDRDPDEDTITVKGKPKPKYYGTVTPHPHFSASSDASVLEKAIETKGVDEDVIISVLVNRSNEQRQQIKRVYETSTGEALADALKSALRSDLEDVVLALLMTPTHFDAHQLRVATKGLGTHEHILSEILASRSNQEIRELRKVFQEEYQEELDDVIKSDTSGDFTLALLALLKANKDEDNEVDMDLAKRDANALFEAGENTKGVDIYAFIDILTSRSGPQLSKTFQQYSAISDVNLPKALRMELRGDIEDCLIDIVKCAWSKPAFFAEKLHLAMKGHGTCDETLIRVLVSRSEVDLKKIIEEYSTMYERSLQEDIVGDTKGHYQKILLALCGPH